MSIISYITEVKAESKNIKWPTKKQVINYTIVVMVLSLLLAIYVGALDAFFAKLLSILLN
jgi:preprotein translocase subunit SecE